jgi:menaquinol-cytochrome c reductase cytochrome b/c subunit
MAEIPESLLRRSAEAKAKALGLPVEQVLAEMKGEAPPPKAEEKPPVSSPESPVEPKETPDAGRQTPEEPEAAEAEAGEEPEAAELEETPDARRQTPEEPEAGAAEPESQPAAVATAVKEAPPPAPETPTPNGGGNGKRAATVSPRPVAPPAGTPEGVRTQRLLTVVKARAIQQVKSEPTDKVNTWPHLMISEFSALLAVTGVLLILSVILQAPLLDPANFNATPNPSKAPWYFLGLQELLSYFDPQIAGVTVPTIVGLIGFFAVPFVDRNPSTKPSDRKFAVMLYTFFMAGAATLTMFGVLFRGLGFNFSFPWRDGIFFDDIRDWVFFE